MNTSKESEEQIFHLYQKYVSFALNLAAAGSQVDIVEMLLNTGIDVNATHDEQGNTPLASLILSICKKYKNSKDMNDLELGYDIIEMLLKKGARVHSVDSNGSSAIMLFAENCDFSIHPPGDDMYDDFGPYHLKILKLLILNSPKNAIENALQKLDREVQKYLEYFVRFNLNILAQAQVLKEKKYFSLTQERTQQKLDENTNFTKNIIQAIDDVLKLDRENSNALNRYRGKTALHYLFENFSFANFSFAKYPGQFTLLIEILEYFLNRGENPNALDKEGNTALHAFIKFVSYVQPEYFSFENFKKIMDVLLKAGLNFHARNKNNENAFHFLANYSYKILEYFLNLGVNPNVTNNKGLNPINYLELDLGEETYIKTRLLLNAGAHTQTIPVPANSLEELKQKLDEDTLASINIIEKLFFTIKTKTNTAPSSRVTILHLFFAEFSPSSSSPPVPMHRVIRILKFFLKNGEDPNAKDDNDNSIFLNFIQALGYLEFENFTKFMELLLKYGLDVHALNENKENILFYARQFDYKNLEYILKLGVNPKVTNLSGHSPIHALNRYYTSAYPINDLYLHTWLLFEAGADPETKCAENFTTSLMMTIINNPKKLGIVDALLEFGIEVKNNCYEIRIILEYFLKDQGSRPPYYNNQELECEDTNSIRNYMVKILLNKGIDINTKNLDDEGRTLLYYVLSSIENLEPDDFDVNFDEDLNNYVYRTDCIPFILSNIKLLLKHGAHVGGLNNNNITALELVAEKTLLVLNSVEEDTDEIVHAKMIKELSEIFKVIIQYSTKKQIEAAFPHLPECIQNLLKDFKNEVYELIAEAEKYRDSRHKLINSSTKINTICKGYENIFNSNLKFLPDVLINKIDSYFPRIDTAIKAKKYLFQQRCVFSPRRKPDSFFHSINTEEICTVIQAKKYLENHQTFGINKIF